MRVFRSAVFLGPVWRKHRDHLKKIEELQSGRGSRFVLCCLRKHTQYWQNLPEGEFLIQQKEGLHLILK